jgi:uncharacterized membrane protein
MSTPPTTLTGRIGRALRHATTGAGAGKRHFPPDTLQAIAQAITRGEQIHRAEVRLIVEPALSASAAFRGMANRERARQLFAEYGIWDTEENCGVLIYVNLAERAVDIVADRHVGRLIGEQQWQAICQAMTTGFAKGEYKLSTVTAIEQLSALLAEHYPGNGSRPNQLPNEAVIL